MAVKCGTANAKRTKNVLTAVTQKNAPIMKKGEWKMENEKATCAFNYEAECERLRMENIKLIEEIQWLKHVEEEVKIRNAQLEIVNLIFGRR